MNASGTSLKLRPAMLQTLGKPLRCPSLAAACKRSASSKAKPSHHDTKMEALVSLYHQSNNFITPENLSAVIDQAFTSPTALSEEQKKHSVRELEVMRGVYKSSPKFFLGRDDSALNLRSSETMGPGWTESKSKRIERVYRTLMGTEKDGRPSWTALKENSERVKSQLEKDKQERGGN